MKTILFHSAKSGSGQSTCLANCAVRLALKGKKVLILDLNIEEAAGRVGVILGIKERKGSSEIVGFTKYLIGSTGLIKEDMTRLASLFPVIAKTGGMLDLLSADPNPHLMDIIQRRYSRPGEMFGNIKQFVTKTLPDSFDYGFLFLDLPAGFNPISDCLSSCGKKVFVFSSPDLTGATGKARILDFHFFENRVTYNIVSFFPNPRKNIWWIEEYGKRCNHEVDIAIPYNKRLFFENGIITEGLASEAFNLITKKI